MVKMSALVHRERKINLNFKIKFKFKILKIFCSFGQGWTFLTVGLVLFLFDKN